MELMVGLVVVGVLAAIAVPGYQRHVRRVNRTEATAALHALLGAQERFHLRQGRYSANLTASPPDGLGTEATSAGGRYALRIELAGDGQSFIASATPTRDGGQADDLECGVFSMDHRGRRAVSGDGGVASCWR